jgi:hypothetical protein
MLQEADWQSAQPQNLFHVEHNKQSKPLSFDINKDTKAQSQGDRKYTSQTHTLCHGVYHCEFNAPSPT